MNAFSKYLKITLAQCPYCGPTSFSIWPSSVFTRLPSTALPMCDPAISPVTPLVSYASLPNIVLKRLDLNQHFFYLHDPRKRIMAAYAALIAPGSTESLAGFPAVLDGKKDLSLKAYYSNPLAKHCQTRILLNASCNSPTTIARTEIGNAIKRLRSLEFIGLADEPALSACLFHHMHGGQPQPSEFVTASAPGTFSEEWWVSSHFREHLL